MHKCFKGGTNGTRQEDILRYNGTTDKWLNVGKMKNPRSSIALKIWQFYEEAEVEMPQVPNLPEAPVEGDLDADLGDLGVDENLEGWNGPVLDETAAIQIDLPEDFGRRKRGEKGWFC